MSRKAADSRRRYRLWISSSSGRESVGANFFRFPRLADNTRVLARETSVRLTVRTARAARPRNAQPPRRSLRGWRCARVKSRPLPEKSIKRTTRRLRIEKDSVKIARPLIFFSVNLMQYKYVKWSDANYILHELERERENKI